MPQIFPMYWNILSILFSISLIMNIIMIFFIPMKSNMFHIPNKSLNMMLFKW
uniref:ATP synthase F0 subunit 8 n=1 Tax=Ixodes simplex TaxID=65648 RepID=UPI001FAFBBA7|nr:ATP synthase F0 subunit 8 [Ixodes simplex]UNO53614.1 ATP synthase F0 subunit 8 [Ixodes simplex]WKW95267.1 ATP synthase subunit 8 [Ixodes vespertilionis]BEI62428.1 ATP synthase F0 subunit 8 [Ixodes fuliginosus]